MKFRLRDMFGEEGPNPNPLSEQLKSDSEAERNNAAIAILEKVMRAHYPFGKAKEAPPAEPGIRSSLRRLFAALQSVEVITADFDTPGNRVLLENVVKAIAAGDIHHYNWDKDAKLRLRSALQVLGKERVDQIRYHPKPDNPFL
jgi:hypothetical protein